MEGTLENYIIVNEGREGLRLKNPEDGSLKDGTVVMEVIPNTLIRLAAHSKYDDYVFINEQCILEGASSYTIKKKYFNMKLFDVKEEG